MTPDPLAWFRRLALLGAVLATTVVVLGAWVRLTHAGLGCPDWPGCYGHLYPQAAQETGRAWHEMIHRYAAITLGAVITSLLVWAVAARKQRGPPWFPVALLFVIVCLQGMLGALTVTLLLQPLIVTAHLIGGLTTMSLLWWLALAPERRALSAPEARLRKFALAAFLLLGCQIFLGGWTSANYAAIACPDLPTCQGSWWPPLDFRNGFVLWRDPAANDVLEVPARLAIQFTHRLGAVVAGSALLLLGLLAAKAGRRRLFWTGSMLVAAVLLQIALGLATVHFGAPLAVATLHNAGAAVLVTVMVWLTRALWPEPPPQPSMSARAL
jgi:cytochrome c oxidase assembly protein subunit 15